MSQTKQILDYLRKGKKITPLDALNRFNCLRLAARISELRAQGHPIESEDYKTKSGKIVARYYFGS